MQTIISDKQCRAAYLCDVDELPVGESKKIEFSGRPPIALYNIGGHFFATDDTCTHATASLSEGDIEDDKVICPVHWAEFHIPTGEALSFPATCPLKTYVVELVGRRVHIIFEE